MIVSHQIKPFEISFINMSKIGPLLSKSALALIAFSFIAIILAFLFFHNQVAKSSLLTYSGKADGIVVFTGGQDRLKAAFDIYQAGGASRMLISGVHKDTSMSAIKNAVGVKTANICCIDLDREALDTRGNAVETAKWVATHNVKSLIIVTSDYHLPRSLIELQRRLPDVKLLPVSAPASKTHKMTAQKALQLYFKEFVKYIAASLNLRLS